MFRAAYRSSSGALTVFAASGLHTHVVTGHSQVFSEWWNNKFYYKFASCWLFLLPHIRVVVLLIMTPLIFVGIYNDMHNVLYIVLTF
jgi:hypothetical protein